MNIQEIIDMSSCEDGQRCVLVLKEKEVKNSPESIMIHSMEFLVKEVYSSNRSTEIMEKRIPKKEISSNSRQKLSRVR